MLIYDQEKKHNMSSPLNTNYVNYSENVRHQQLFQCPKFDLLNAINYYCFYYKLMNNHCH